MADKGTIYLSGRWLEGVPGMIEVPADTLVALFTLQYCQNKGITVVLVTSRVEAKTCKFPVSVDSLCFGIEVRGDEECPEVVRHCELPAMIPKEKEEEVVREQCKENGVRQTRHEEAKKNETEVNEAEREGNIDDKEGNQTMYRGNEKQIETENKQHKKNGEKRTRHEEVKENVTEVNEAEREGNIDDKDGNRTVYRGNDTQTETDNKQHEKNGERQTRNEEVKKNKTDIGDEAEIEGNIDDKERNQTMYRGNETQIETVEHEKNGEKRKKNEEVKKNKTEVNETEREGNIDDKDGNQRVYRGNEDQIETDNKQHEKNEEKRTRNEEAKKNEAEREGNIDDKDGNQTVYRGNEDQIETERDGTRYENSATLTIGPWCCAGLCSSLRLAVQQLTDTRTLENNRSNRYSNRSKDNNSNNRNNGKKRKGGGGESSVAKGNEGIVCNTAGNTREGKGNVGNTVDLCNAVGNTDAEDKIRTSNTPSNTGTPTRNSNTPSSNITSASNTGLATEHKSNTNKTIDNENNTKIDVDRKNNKDISDANLSGAPHYAASLLGFRGGCLQACAEVSVWTKFCEVEAPLALLSMALAPYGGEEVMYPEELVRYESHLRRPPILHNALKRVQKQIKEMVKGGTERDEMLRRPLALLPPLSHQYAEGPDMTLADLMLFCCFHVLLTNLTSAAVDPVAVTPLVSSWHGTMVLNEHVQAALPVLEGAKSACCSAGRSGVSPRVVVPGVPDVSIYKSDPERSKASRGAFTKQGDVVEVLTVVEGAAVEPQYIHWPPRSTSSTSPFSSPTSTTVPLHTLLQALSLEGHIPESRSARKAEQVENVCSAVLALSRPGDVIVDFCSGGGHVGIPLAQCLPQCHIMLVENKVPSLRRARERVRALRLPNVSFVQSNLDYFRGAFNVGVSLHACGVATDLVLGKCLAQGAAFVVAPCCYGGIRPNHVVSYPRSQAFRRRLTLEQYLILGHAADQTHGSDNPKTEQGQRCMRLVDGDRLAAVREAGYVTGLALMHPPTCSPKNHLLLGKPETPPVVDVTTC